MWKQSICSPGGVWSQGWNLKELTEGHHQEWNLRLNLTQHGETYQDRIREGLTDWKLFLDCEESGAWPFLVGGVICLVNSVNERDLNLLIRPAKLGSFGSLPLQSELLRGTNGIPSRWKFEAKTGLWCPSMPWAARALHWLLQRVLPLPEVGWVSWKGSRDGDCAL
jgi:hypothetical protein